MSGSNTSELPVNRDHHFGACPECGGSDGYINVRKSHWFVCDAHRTRWWAGSGLFSSWHDENEDIWARNAERLGGYREVEPLEQVEPDQEDVEPD